MVLTLIVSGILVIFNIEYFIVILTLDDYRKSAVLETNIFNIEIILFSKSFSQKNTIIFRL